jgi:hypothetical protein
LSLAAPLRMAGVGQEPAVTQVTSVDITETERMDSYGCHRTKKPVGLVNPAVTQLEDGEQDGKATVLPTSL